MTALDPTSQPAKRQSQTTVAWAALICIALGAAIMSPTAGFLLYLIGLLLALHPVIFGSKTQRIAGALLLLLSLALLVQAYDSFRQESDAYRQHSDTRSR